MPPEDIRRWLRQLPFRPFRIHVLETSWLDVHHPDHVLIHLGTLDYFAKTLDPDEPWIEWQGSISLRHISKIDLLKK